MSQIEKLNQPMLFMDFNLMDVFDNDGKLVCGIEMEATKNGNSYMNIYFDGKPFKYFESDIADAKIDSDIKLDLLRCFEEFKEIMESDDDDPDHRADLLREWREERE